MSLTAAGGTRLASVPRPGRLASGGVLVRALLASRLLVLLAGAAGTILVSRADGWQQFDPAQVSSSFGWLGDALTGGAVRWDSIHYLQIAAHGYGGAPDTAFLPLYPLLIRALGYLTGSLVASGLAISIVSFGVGLMLLHRLTELELGEQAADATVLLLAFAPLSFFFTSLYTESLFLALSVGAVYSARRDRWALAGGLAALASVTRITGIVLVIPLTILYLRGHGRVDRAIGWIALAPAALLGWFGYLAARGFGWLSPASSQTLSGYGRHLAGPLETLTSAARAAVSGIRAILGGVDLVYAPTLSGPFSSGAESVLLLTMLVVAVLLLLAVIARLPIAYGAYASVALLVCIWSSVPRQPLISLDRYLLTIFPLWMAAGAWLSQRRLTRPAVMLGAGMLAFWAFQFATWSFVA